MDRPSWAPDDIDLEQPSIARVYDYFLGGSHNFAADRAFAEEILKLTPQAARITQEHRAFLRRAVRHLRALGIRQFIDLSSGIPTVGNVHEVADEAASGSRVAYIDADLVSVAHRRAILADHPNTVIIAGDLRKPATVLDDPELHSVIDFAEPVAVLFVSVLHFVPDGEDPSGIVAEYAATAVPGSYVVISHDGLDRAPTDREAAMFDVYRRWCPLTPRNPAEVAALFGDLTLLEPGIVEIPRWRPEAGDDTTPDPSLAWGYCGIGRLDPGADR